MPTPKRPKIQAWSFSRWNVYQQCPYKAFLKFIEKLPEEPSNEAMERGTRIHKAGEDYLNGKLRRVPTEYKNFEAQLKALRNREAQAELQLAFDKDWHPTDWFASDTWVRVKIDALDIPEDGVVDVIDFKTGKIRDGYEAQLDLYKLAAIAAYELDYARSQLWYVDQNTRKGHDEPPVPPTMFEPLKKAWANRTRAMLNDTRYDPRPSYLCRYCHFSKSNNGPCEY